MKKVIKVLIVIGFFILGLALAYWSSQSKAVESETAVKETAAETEDQDSFVAWKEEELESEANGLSVGGSGVSTKFTIVESKPMTASRTYAQTGQEIIFSTAIKNEGPEMKNLTHLCFNHSGGVSFGCLNGPAAPTLDPGKEMGISNGMIFTHPGTYYVWLTWSQDKTNFYRPLRSTSVKVMIE